MNIIIIQATDEEMATMTLAEIVAKSAAPVVRESAVERVQPYTVDEAAEALSLSKASVYAKVQAGLIKRVKGTGKVLIPSGEIKRMLEGE